MPLQGRRVQVVLLAALFVLTGCANRQEAPQPLDLPARQARLLRPPPTDASGLQVVLQAMLESGTAAAQVPSPITGAQVGRTDGQNFVWTPAHLIQLAWARSPTLVAASLRQKQAETEARRLSQQAGLNWTALDLSLEHRGQPTAGNSPWTLGLGLELALGGADRKSALAAQAQAAAIEAAADRHHQAWQLRMAVMRAWAQLMAEEAEVAELQDARNLMDRQRDAAERKLRHGSLAAQEVLPLRLSVQQARRDFAEAERRRQQAKLALGHVVGVPADFPLPVRLNDGDRLPPDSAEAPSQDEAEGRSTLAAQRLRLQQRADLAAALARHAQAEADLRLELARQAPELSLKPGLAWDQGEQRWSLGLGLALPVGLTLGRPNEVGITAALARREQAAHQVIDLQWQALVQLDQARLRLQQARDAQAQARQALVQAEAARARAERLEQLGVTDRQDSLQAAEPTLASQRLWRQAQAELAQARLALEDAVQAPLSQDEPRWPAAVATAATAATAATVAPAVIPSPSNIPPVGPAADRKSPP